MLLLARAFRTTARITKSRSNTIVIRFNAIRTRNSMGRYSNSTRFFPAGRRTGCLPLVYTQNRPIFAVHSHFPSWRKPFVQNQQRRRNRLHRRITPIRLIDDLYNSVLSRRKHLLAAQKLADLLETLMVHLRFGEIIKARANLD